MHMASLIVNFGNEGCEDILSSEVSVRSCVIIQQVFFFGVLEVF